MLGAVKDFVLSSMCPCEVPAQREGAVGQRFGGRRAEPVVAHGKPRASPDSTGSIAGVNMPMMSVATVPGRIDQLSPWLPSRAYRRNR